MTSTVYRSLALAWCCLLPSLSVRAADETEKPKAKAPPPAVWVDMREVIPRFFNYGTWQGKVASTPAGTMVQGLKGAQGSGGFGSTFEQEVDLTREAFLEIGLAVGLANEVPEFTLACSDADGTQSSVRIRIDQLMPQQPVWMRVRPTDMALTKGQEGSDGKMNWARINQWHVQGDWKTAKPFHVVFIALRSVKVPEKPAAK